MCGRGWAVNKTDFCAAAIVGLLVYQVYLTLQENFISVSFFQYVVTLWYYTT